MGNLSGRPMIVMVMVVSMSCLPRCCYCCCFCYCFCWALQQPSCASLLHARNPTCCTAPRPPTQELLEVPATAMSKYARDLTALARECKLDPVIGRSEEMRRCGGPWGGGVLWVSLRYPSWSREGWEGGGVLLYAMFAACSPGPEPSHASSYACAG